MNIYQKIGFAFIHDGQLISFSIKQRSLVCLWNQNSKYHKGSSNHHWWSMCHLLPRAQVHPRTSNQIWEWPLVWGRHHLMAPGDVLPFHWSPCQSPIGCVFYCSICSGWRFQPPSSRQAAHSVACLPSSDIFPCTMTASLLLRRCWRQPGCGGDRTLKIKRMTEDIKNMFVGHKAIIYTLYTWIFLNSITLDTTRVAVSV